MKIAVFILSAVVANSLSAQPYIDVISPVYIKNTSQVEYYTIASNLPLQSGNKKTTVVFSPYFEDWKLELPAISQHYSGYGVPLTLLQTLKNEKWQIAASIIFRDNDLKNYAGREQWGGAFVMSYKQNAALTCKTGLYYNKEYFGNFFMPLLGIDWRINKRTQLFGLLPGSLTIEHKTAKKIYTGASFRAVTTSFILPNKDYIRMNDNRLGLFADLQLLKTIVLNAEAGHSIMRKFQTGNPVSKTDLPVKDHPYIKLQLAYRIRFSNH